MKNVLRDLLRDPIKEMEIVSAARHAESDSEFQSVPLRDSHREEVRPIDTDQDKPQGAGVPKGFPPPLFRGDGRRDA